MSLFATAPENPYLPVKKPVSVLELDILRIGASVFVINSVPLHKGTRTLLPLMKKF